MARIFQGCDGCYYFLLSDGELSDPFEIKARAREALNQDDYWELDLPAALDDLFDWQKYYDFPLSGDLF
jgi:hypothetical protein